MTTPAGNVPSVSTRLRVLFVTVVGSAASAVVVWAFLVALDAATELRLDQPGLVWLLPVAGFMVAGTYHSWGGRAKGGTPAVVEQAGVFTHGAPARMTPLVFGGAVVGHAVGASVGREGGALQITGSITDTIARHSGLGARQRRTLLAASLAAGWGAAYGVPVTGVVFGLQLVRTHRWRTLPLAVIAALVGNGVVAALGSPIAERPTVAPVDWSGTTVVALVVCGIVCGLLARLFVGGLHRVRAVVAHRVPSPPLRGVVGGLLTLGGIALVGRDYLGLSLPLLDTAFGGADTAISTPLLKLLFTVVALGTGFVGGEVAPLFVIGGTAGAAIATWLGVAGAERIVMATTGSAVTFAAAASAGLTGVVLSVEQFGRHALGPALIVAAVARIVAGRPDLYRSHH